MNLDIPFEKATIIKNSPLTRGIVYEYKPEFYMERLPKNTKKQIININGISYLRLQFEKFTDWTFYALKYK